MTGLRAEALRTLNVWKVSPLSLAEVCLGDNDLLRECDTVLREAWCPPVVDDELLRGLDREQGAIVCALRRLGHEATVEQLARGPIMSVPFIDIVDGVVWLEECPSPCPGCGEVDTDDQTQSGS